MQFPSEFSRLVPLRRLGALRTDDDGVVVVEADAAERARLAGRLLVPAIAALRCRFRLGAADRDGVVAAEGLLEARLTRICVATLEPFEQDVVERFSVRFVPAAMADGQGEAGLDLEADDDVPYEAAGIDLGEAAVQQLALALDPYPHRPGAELPAGVTLGDPPAGAAADGRGADGSGAEGGAEGAAAEGTGPFAVLARLRDRH